MKDEGRTHRLRLSPKMLCFIVGILMLIPIGFATSVWLNIHLYKERSAIIKNQIMLQYTVDQNAQTIARLSNLEGFLRDHSPGLLGLLVSQSNVNTMLVPTIGKKDEKLANELKKLAMENPIPLPPKVENVSTNVKNTNTIEQNVNSAKNNTATSATETKDKTNLVQKGEQNSTPAQEIKQSIDLGYVTLQNVQANLTGNNIQIQYYLKNTGRDIPLLGEQKYTLVNMKNDKIKRTLLTNATNDNFRIRNLKIVESTIQLAGIKIDAKDRIQIDIVRNGTVLFRESYPIVR